MQHQNPYGQLMINPPNCVKVVPIEQIQQAQYAQYAPQYQIQQQPIISNAKINLVPQNSLYCPQIEVNPLLDVSNLIKYSTNPEKSKFIMKVAFIGLIQQTIMLTVASNSLKNETLKKLFFKNNVLQWQFYLLIMITITSIFLCRFLKPAKDVMNSSYFKYFLQGVILVGMTVLYIFSASAISIVLDYNYFWFLVILFSQQLAFVSVLISQAIKYKDERIFQKFINIQFFMVALPVIVILIFYHPNNNEYGYQSLFVFVIVGLGLIVLGWSLCFGIFFLYSIQQLTNGKCNLQKVDFLAASTIVYGNMMTPIC